MFRSAPADRSATAASLAALACLLGCFGEPSGVDETGSTSSGESDGTSGMATTSTSTSTSTSTTATTTTTTSQTTDVGVDTTQSSSSTTGSCIEVSTEVPGITVPTDLFLAIRSGPSMADSAAGLQAAFSNFSQSADEPPGDAHIVLITEPPANAPGVCLDPPMANRGCPALDDSKLPHFLRLAGIDDADDPITAIVAGLENTIAAGVLRDDGNKIFAVITDQDTNFDAGDFANVLQTAGPDFAGARVFAASGEGVGCVATPNLDQIVTAFQGTSVGLCPFEMGAELLATLSQRRASCSFMLPPPPEGTSGESVTAELAIDDQPLSIAVHATAAECNANPAGFIDNSEQPPRLRLCPATCAEFQDNSLGLPTSLLLNFQCDAD